MKQDCFKVLAVLFTVINQVFFIAIISFSLIITIIVIIIIVFLILILFILFSIYHDIFFIKYYSHFTIFLFIFPSFIHFLFWVHFCSIFFIYLLFCHFPFPLCFKWVHQVLHLHVVIFNFILTGLCKSSEKNVKIIWTIGKTQVPFAFVVVLLLVLSWTIHFIHHLYISHNAPFLPSKIFHNLCFSFILGITAVPRETENNASTQNFGRQIKYIMRDVQVAYFSPPSHTCHWTSHPTPSPTSLPGSSSTQPQKGALGTRFPRAWRSSAIHVFLV